MDSDLPTDNRALVESRTKTRSYEKREQNTLPSPVRRGDSWNISTSSDRKITSTKPLTTKHSEVNTISQLSDGKPHKLTRSKNEGRALKYQLERANEEVMRLENEKNKTERNYHDLCNAYHNLELNLEQRYQQAMDQAEHHWMREYDLSKANIQNLKQQLEHEKQRVASVKQQADQIHMEKDTSMVIFAPQMMDSNVCEDFGSLLDDIRTWSTHFSFDTGRMPDFKSGIFSRYQQVVPMCTSPAGIVSFLNQYRDDERLDGKSRKQLDKMHKRNFIRVWASFVMYERCFCSPDSWLRTTNSEAVHHIERVLSETGNNNREGVVDREVHDWRALTAHLLSKATPQATQDKLMGKLASKAASEVIGLVHPWAKSLQPEELEQSLADIYQAAIELSSLLRKQRAYWEVYFPTKDGNTDSLRYDSFSMEDFDNKTNNAPTPDRRVGMVIEPALSKTGRIDGTKFEAGAHVTMKAKVCLAV